MQLPASKTTAPLDTQFRPAALAHQEYLRLIEESGKGEQFKLCLERGDGSTSVYETQLLPENHPRSNLNIFHLERILKFLLWQKGGCKVYACGNTQLGSKLKNIYSPIGERAFDAEFMGGVYEKPFGVVVCDLEEAPQSSETTQALGRHLDGFRIGFDAGASDRKVSAVANGEAVFSDEVIWHPRDQSDPDYHYQEVVKALRQAAEHLPRVDAIGVSSAGVYINNRVKVGSIFRGIPKDKFDSHIRDMFIRIGEEWGVPLEVVNDGEVTALAGSMSLGVNAILGVAMGSSEAAGYVTREGTITQWLNELAFAPIDYSLEAPRDEWSGDRGVGANYFSQQAIFRLAPAAGIHLDETLGLADKLKKFQDLFIAGDERTLEVYETIGVYLGHGMAHYSHFYDMDHALILGRVTSGEGGAIVIAKAKHILADEYPEIAEKLTLHLPDEKSRRVGQSIAAASLPEIVK